MIGEYRTNLDGERQRGPWLYISSDNPRTARYCARLDANGRA